MKGFSTLSKHIFIYIAICVISFILVSTICYKADYKHIYNYYSDRLYLQANEIANEYALDYLAESKLRRIELEMKSLSTFNDTRIYTQQTHFHIYSYMCNQLYSCVNNML
ncbi:two-component system OmpR family phosphate regulon sensor histidine kinase PhoR [Lachnospira eligens CAG:72]|uniref:Two-component system OmpR family phosphate regulon sensor histidine kinase PhoR n=1 Tax=Lachnospira eligens CAG:72 TaxID=1263077 RepID=R5ZNZ3_9FIRM|nr:two-component system OmpR family phosphate regulon sensor histidine kinase PhoR [[Eubacterium] eligens CAG:72]